MSCRAERRAERRAGPAEGRAGFTMVELLVVIALLALLSTVALTGFAARGADAASTARALAGLHDTARELAVTRATEARLTVDLASGAWVVALGDAQRPLIERSGRIGLAEDVRLTSVSGPRVTAAYDPLGRARASLVAVSDGHHGYGLMVDPWTGGVEVVRVR